MIEPRTLLNYPTNFQNICWIYPPKVKDVVGNEEFGLYKKLLTISQEEIEDDFNKQGLDLSLLLNPFEYLLNCCYNNKNLQETVKRAFMFFIQEPIMFLFEQKKIIVGEFKNIKRVENLRIISEENYFDFQNCLRAVLGEEKLEPPNPFEDPRIRKIKAKARERERIKAQKNMGLNLTSTLASISCMGFGLNPLNIGELSYAAISVLIRYYQEKEKYETDVKSLLAGADSKKVKPQFWVRNLD